MSRLIYRDKHDKATKNLLIADETEFWWNERKPDERTLWQSKIVLSEKFFNEIISHPVPLEHEHPEGTHAQRDRTGPVRLAQLPGVRP